MATMTYHSIKNYKRTGVIETFEGTEFKRSGNHLRPQGWWAESATMGKAYRLEAIGIECFYTRVDAVAAAKTKMEKHLASLGRQTAKTLDQLNALNAELQAKGPITD